MNEIRNPYPTFRAAAIAGALVLSLTGCKSKTAETAGINGQDPADANLAQPYTGGEAGGYNNGQAQVMGQSESYSPQASGQSYETQAPAPIIRQAPAGTTNNTEYYPVPQAQNAQYGDPNGVNYTDAEEAGEQALAETDQAPPPLPEYDQPPAPADNYIWTPGYWNYANTGYYWVPGVWCAPPFYGALWTPPYWGYSGSHYLFHRGYWGPHIGYYGGINYGFGYVGFGYFGGYWNNRNFYYNRAVTNVNPNVIHNVYDRTVVYNNHTYGPHPENRIDYTGGRGGLNVQPRPQEIAAMHEAHYAPVPAQRENRVAAASNRGQFFAANGGRPAQAFVGHPLGSVANIAATPREQAFNHPAGGNFRPGMPNPAENNRPGEPNRPGEMNHPGPVNQPNASVRPGEFNRPGAPNQPNAGNRPGEFNRPGTPNQPNAGNRPGEFNRPGAPNQPNMGNRPGEFNRPGTPNQPNAGNRPGEFNHPGTPNQPAADRRGEPAPISRPGQPGFGGNRPEEHNNAARPAPEANRSADFHANQPNTPRTNPGLDRNTQANPAYNHVQPPSQPSAARPTFQPRPEPAARPNFEPARPAAPMGQQRSAPAPEFHPAAPAPAPRPAEHAAPESRPAPHSAPSAPSAPHGGGGNGADHGHGH